MNVTLDLNSELGRRLRLAAEHHGVSTDAYTLQLLDRHLPCGGSAADLVSLLQSWMDVNDDADEQRETGDYLVRALDEDRPSGRRLFPSEQKGVTW